LPAAASFGPRFVWQERQSTLSRNAPLYSFGSPSPGRLLALQAIATLTFFSRGVKDHFSAAKYPVNTHN
jgi:hypothetical protein